MFQEAAATIIPVKRTSTWQVVGTTRQNQYYNEEHLPLEQFYEHCSSQMKIRRTKFAGKNSFPSEAMVDCLTIINIPIICKLRKETFLIIHFFNFIASFPDFSDVETIQMVVKVLPYPISSKLLKLNT
ncbi:hypothetical protein [Enterococcus faecium]|uniref:hypothetical protein n=1 Tax=Enterococcus faecium TaxID=1352 RepID=UPI0039C6FF52